MRVVIAPDSYKGSLTANEVGLIMSRAVTMELPEAEIHLFPMADGGEGTVEAVIQARNGEWVDVDVTGPLGDQVKTRFGVFRENGQETAVMEVANIFGLPMVAPPVRHPFKTTSRGLGEMMTMALDRGCRRFVVGLGGSATNDGGMGMLAALGARFRKQDGEELAGFGKDIIEVADVDLSRLDPRLKESSILIASDVTNPLTGPVGATAVFGPQKGASPEDIDVLDRGMVRYAAMLERFSSITSSDSPGAGAAGGLGFALLALGGVMESGAEVIARMTGIKERIGQADLVLTGEGRSDEQTVFGKLPYRVAEWAGKFGVPTILISGSIDPESRLLQDSFAGCFSIVNQPSTLEECMNQAAKNVEHCTRNVVRLAGHYRKRGRVEQKEDSVGRG